MYNIVIRTFKKLKKKKSTALTLKSEKIDKMELESLWPVNDSNLTKILWKYTIFIIR